jgi:hypothetical protein
MRASCNGWAESHRLRPIGGRPVVLPRRICKPFAAGSSSLTQVPGGCHRSSPPRSGQPTGRSFRGPSNSGDAGYVLVSGRLIKAATGKDLLDDRAIGRRFLGGQLKLVAGKDRRVATQAGLFEQHAGLRRLGDIAERACDQPPFLVGGEDAPRLQAGDERGVIGEQVAP